jgi:hypothetical protein
LLQEILLRRSPSRRRTRNQDSPAVFLKKTVCLFLGVFQVYALDEKSIIECHEEDDAVFYFACRDDDQRMQQ